VNILVTGSSGFVGSAIVEYLKSRDQSVIRLVRDERIKGHDIAHWDPERGTIESERLVDIDAVVHLAGENLASGRWNTQRKARIRDSRVNGTLLLSETIAGLRPLPKVFLSASASGYYGDRNDEVLTEDSGSGDDFLANVVIEWESATKSASDVGIRVVTMRAGLVLHPDGGALKRMLPPFKLGIGGRLGDGMHYMPWITLHDMTRAILHILENDALVGPTTVASLAENLSECVSKFWMVELKSAVQQLYWLHSGASQQRIGDFSEDQSKHESRHGKYGRTGDSASQ